VCATLVAASHAGLDTLTGSGLGCALFWPFDLTRYFAPLLLFALAGRAAPTRIRPGDSAAAVRQRLGESRVVRRWFKIQ
jgi:hypothetical protein